jgi:hypothetical protein
MHVLTSTAHCGFERDTLLLLHRQEPAQQQQQQQQQMTVDLHQTAQQMTPLPLLLQLLPTVLPLLSCLGCLTRLILQ